MKIDIGQLEFIDKKLRKLVIWLEKETGLTFAVTSLYRIDDPGVHGTMPLRGGDFRMRDYMIGKVIESFINEHWTYDPARPAKRCAKLHGEGSNLHLHIQVHPNTMEVANED
jgi:hypothetical protein